MSCNLARRWARKIPLLVAMATIFILSHQPGDTLQLPSIPGLDKVAHAVIYGVLAASALYAFTPNSTQYDPRARAAAVVVFCVLFGLVDEYHQSFIPGRWASGWDLVADGLGGAMVAGLWWWRRSAESSRAVGYQ
jgi:VanZ family protein